MDLESQVQSVKADYDRVKAAFTGLHINAAVALRQACEGRAAEEVLAEHWLGRWPRTAPTPPPAGFESRLVH